MEVASPFPSTPTRLGDLFFFSAPASPSRVSDFFHPTPTNNSNEDDTEFAFEYSKDLERTSLSADELFLGGVIRPLQAIERGRSARSLSPPKLSSPAKSSRSASSSSKKWRLRDFLLFRSASEGRAAEKDPLRKYSAVTAAEAMGRRPRRRSAHEVHYVANKAVSEEMKKKTFLPYKQGILGRLAFNPALHAIANGFGSLSLSRA